MAKNMANFCENCKNLGKITAKTQRQNMGPNIIIQLSLHVVQGFQL